MLMIEKHILRCDDALTVNYNIALHTQEAYTTTTTTTTKTKNKNKNGCIDQPKHIPVSIFESKQNRFQYEITKRNKNKTEYSQQKNTYI